MRILALPLLLSLLVASRTAAMSLPVTLQEK